MGVFVKIIDAILFVMFAIVAVNAVLIDVQLCLPQSLFPSSLVELKNWYVREFDDYLGEEKPHFYVGLVWVELLLQWPLLVANLYGILAAKPWYRTTCLLYGASFFTTMGAILPELLWSGKASNTMLMLYYPAVGFAVLAILRGLLPPSNASTSTSDKRTTKSTGQPKYRKVT
ncbi:transmembrane protein 97-like [Pyrus ussuriensis x Pyrus communis]|uniref:Transmembrane protein 97-like n=1 Tax=Pyrus ussuriensis x Pyrus communis TaxID=2448454 RepID=A0A5N5GB11_9ROSA|nr:transmembrane protein 97-like [Pyrus ussuriensis x Pyrus communis]